MTIEALCSKFGMSRATYYRLRARGEGPRETRIGKLVRITEQAEREWIAAREAAPIAA